ncbi:holo-ACP synthase [Alicyclobacillus vulcanalis]|uniref:Holo-[acyl-carrier-protein] synthase n=1 Tax=Alicyclobacillus vulcanalis TaxID=252246 RepID=A0A1N7P496_9BACL|nr:holo-ACP synthase [Alicyclobacillus vulcanalis]SIT05411.1 holo-[acyl-carrier protein] synthase [Alicyclobacillus vulcanalis]
MVIGLGNDLVEIERIRAAIARRGNAFLARVLSAEELGRARAMSDSARLAEFVAGRFAAKEAIAKAAGCGLARLSMPHVSVRVGDAGLGVTWEPASALWERFGPPGVGPIRLHLALTHAAGLALATAVIEER